MTISYFQFCPSAFHRTRTIIKNFGFFFSIENRGNNETRGQKRLSGKCFAIAMSSAPNSVDFQGIFGEVNEKMKMGFEMDLKQ